MQLRELQQYKLNILKDIVEICDKNHLQYFLFWGTLLGAVRHDGFIPWDDDIDVVLFWDDYRTLIEILKTERKEKYFVQNIWTEPNCPFLYTQLRVLGTTSMPLLLRELEIHWGICIDLFPMVSVSDDNQKYEKQKKAFQLASSLIAKEQMEALGSKPAGKQRFINLIPKTIRRMLARYIMKKYAADDHKTEYVCGIDGSTFCRRFRRADFSPASMHTFEGTLMKIPENYDAILSESYGDYMTLPPPEQRGGHELTQGETIIDPNRDYTEYIKTTGI